MKNPFKTSLKEAWAQLSAGSVIVSSDGKFFTVLKKFDDGKLVFSFSDAICSVPTNQNPFEYVGETDRIIDVDGQPFEALEMVLRSKHDMYKQHQDAMAAAEAYEQRRATKAIESEQFVDILHRLGAQQQRVRELFYDDQLNDRTIQARVLLETIFGKDVAISDDHVALMTVALATQAKRGGSRFDVTMVNMPGGFGEYFFRQLFAH